MTFRQALYESYYVPRPIVPVESGGHVLPPPDTGTVAGEVAAKASPAAPDIRDAARAGRRGNGHGGAGTRPAPPPAPIEAAAAPRKRRRSPSPRPTRSASRPGRASSCRCSTANCRRAASISISPRSTRSIPLAAIELTNKSDTGLPPGVLTLYQLNAEQGALYLGDARLAALPAGDKRLLSYAVDGKVTVDRSERRTPAGRQGDDR